MTPREELHRRVLLHDQAAELLRQDVDRHESEAKRLREEAALFRETGVMNTMKLEALTENLPGDHCLLCGGAPVVVGVFIPQDPEAWGSTKGKGRIFRYCLCESCQKKPDSPERVEKIIRVEIAGGGVTHAE